MTEPHCPRRGWHGDCRDPVHRKVHEVHQAINASAARVLASLSWRGGPGYPEESDGHT